MAMTDKKIIFLHIPKTAGQSVHAALVDAYGADAVCPARVNEQLAKMSVAELNRYKVFSGHLDWSLLDCIKGPRYLFTILRDPRDRILSFYFFLRDQAKKLSPEELRKPQNQGLNAALNLHPRDYFMGGEPSLRSFLDDHYDNFYTYFFAGRYYQARRSLAGLLQRGVLTREKLLQLAVSNLGILDGVFHVTNMRPVFEIISELSGVTIKDQDRYRVNVNSATPAEQRVERMEALGAGEQVWKQLQAYCDLDNALCARIQSRGDELNNVSTSEHHTG